MTDHAKILCAIKAAILEAPLEVLRDTLWIPPRISFNETVVDYIDAALSEAVVADEALDFMLMLNALRRGGGLAVTLVCDNPDFNGQPNCAVDVCGEWTGWHDKRFGGDTLHEALKAAFDAMQAADALTGIDRGSEA